jgi:SHS2 domain-containing protein
VHTWKVYRWVEHTGELEMEIKAPDEATVFADAVAALHELLADGPRGAAESRELAVEATDRAVLLAEFLTELLFRVETEDFVPFGLSSFELEDRHLRATVDGYRGRPPHLVKAVTYHGLGFERVNGGWRASVVLDV